MSIEDKKNLVYLNCDETVVIISSILKLTLFYPFLGRQF